MKRKEENDQLKALRFLNGRNVLIDYYREIVTFLIYGEVLEMVFEGGLEGMGGALISVRLFWSYKAWLAAAVIRSLSLEGSRRDAAM
jgi:hypothetical protein